MIRTEEKHISCEDANEDTDIDVTESCNEETE
jgi:hypothetical protein